MGVYVGLETQHRFYELLPVVLLFCWFQDPSKPKSKPHMQTYKVDLEE